MGGERENLIQERSYKYALRAIRLFQALQDERNGAGYVVGKQFLRAATSVGANVEEAQSAESRADFIHKLTIAQKESRESRYWLRIVRDSGLLPKNKLVSILEESDSLIAILGAILLTAKGKRSLRPVDS